jgi:hypothetical protein
LRGGRRATYGASNTIIGRFTRVVINGGGPENIRIRIGTGGGGGSTTTGFTASFDRERYGYFNILTDITWYFTGGV